MDPLSWCHENYYSRLKIVRSIILKLLFEYRCGDYMNYREKSRNYSKIIENYSRKREKITVWILEQKRQKKR